MSVLRITYLLSRRGGNEADVSPLRLLATFRSSAGPGQFPSKMTPDTAPVLRPYSSGAIEYAYNSSAMPFQLGSRSEERATSRTKYHHGAAICACTRRFSKGQNRRRV